MKLKFRAKQVKFRPLTLTGCLPITGLIDDGRSNDAVMQGEGGAAMKKLIKIAPKVQMPR